jgi:hypothetical protein
MVTNSQAWNASGSAIFGWSRFNKSFVRLLKKIENQFPGFFAITPLHPFSNPDPEHAR